MQRRLAYLLILALAFAANSLCAAVEIESAFDPVQVASGEYTRYVITIKGSATSSMQGEIPVVDGLLILDNPSRSSKVSIVNGSVTTYVQYVYSVRSEREGTFTIPAYEVVVDGKRQRVPAASFVATSSGRENDDAVLVEVEAPKRMYVGQSAKATLRILVRNDLRLAGLQQQKRCEAFQQAPFANDLVKESSLRRGLATYRAIVAPMVITAVDEGAQDLTYASDVQVIVPRRSSSVIGGLSDPMEEMMRNMQSRVFDEVDGTKRDLHAEGTAKVEVLPLPAGAPPSFDGALGVYHATRTVSATEGKVGEPVEIVVTIEAEGSLRNLFAPRLDPHPAWRAYPPSESAVEKDALGLAGTKTFRYLVTPQQPGLLPIPATCFSYFDPEQGRYVETVLEGETIKVTGEAIAQPVVEKPGAPVQLAVTSAVEPSGMHTIHLLDTPAKPGALIAPNKDRVFLFAQLVPALLIALAIAIPLMWRRAAKDPFAAQRRASLKAARASLSSALDGARHKDPDVFYSYARRALQHAAAAKEPGREAPPVSTADLERLLHDDEALAVKAAELFNGVEARRYGAAPPMDAEMIRKLQAIVAKLGVK